MALVITKKTRTILFIVLGVLVVGGGGFLFWRINQQDTVAPTDSDAYEPKMCRRCIPGVCVNGPYYRDVDACIAEEGVADKCVGCNYHGRYCSMDNTEEYECGVSAYYITYTAGAGGSVSNPGKNSVVPNGSISSTATPNSGYKFVKWSDNKTTAARTDSNIQADATYTATFEVVPVETVTLTYTAGANGKITGTTPQIIDKGASGTAVTATPNAGYTFEKWSDGKTVATRTDVNVQDSATYTATFKSTSPSDPVNCTGFTLSCGPNNTININWNLVPGASQYVARINKAPKSDWLNKEGGDVWISFADNVNSYVIENAQSGVVYGVSVVAYSGPDAEKDFHPSCNMTTLEQAWHYPMYFEISCQGTTPIVVSPPAEVPQTGLLDTVLGRVSLGISFIFLGGLVTRYSMINTFYNGVVERAQFRADVRKEKRATKRRDNLERKFE